MDTRFLGSFRSFLSGLTEMVDQTVDWSTGSRYFRVSWASGPRSGETLCFVNTENGDILRPASQTAPAVGARGNLYDEQNGLGRIHAEGVEKNPVGRRAVPQILATPVVEENAAATL